MACRVSFNPGSEKHGPTVVTNIRVFRDHVESTDLETLIRMVPMPENIFLSFLARTRVKRSGAEKVTFTSPDVELVEWLMGQPQFPSVSKSRVRISLVARELEPNLQGDWRPSLLPVRGGVARWCPCATGPTAQGHRKVDPTPEEWTWVLPPRKFFWQMNTLV